MFNMRKVVYVGVVVETSSSEVPLGQERLPVSYVPQIFQDFEQQKEPRRRDARYVI